MKQSTRRAVNKAISGPPRFRTTEPPHKHPTYRSIYDLLMEKGVSPSAAAGFKEYVPEYELPWF